MNEPKIYRCMNCGRKGQDSAGFRPSALAWLPPAGDDHAGGVAVDPDSRACLDSAYCMGRLDAICAATLAVLHGGPIPDTSAWDNPPPFCADRLAA